jgi:putative spermidine/putrescine transport system permease protein
LISGIVNSAVAAVLTTLLATTLGTMAALGISRPDFPARRLVMAPADFANDCAGDDRSGRKLPVFRPIQPDQYTHRLGAGAYRAGDLFVVVTVTATLSTYDTNLTRAALSLGASPLAAFFCVTLPSILPGVISGAIFAFAISFDEVVVALFMTGAEQRPCRCRCFPEFATRSIQRSWPQRPFC